MVSEFLLEIKRLDIIFRKLMFFFLPEDSFSSQIFLNYVKEVIMFFFFFNDIFDNKRAVEPTEQG